MPVRLDDTCPMVAQIQRVAVFVALLAACLAWWWTGQAAWNLGARLLVGAAMLLPHAPVLALEFLLLATVGQDRSHALPSAFGLVKAWLGEVAAGLRVFAWRQPFRAHLHPDAPHVHPASLAPDDFGLGGSLTAAVPVEPGAAFALGPPTPLLFLHGFACNRGLWLPWLARCEREGRPYMALTLTPAFGSIDDMVPQVDRAVAQLHGATGRAPRIVAHSMGGLVARAWLASRPGAINLVDRVVTIGTPHRGTWLARWAVSANGRQMRLNSPWLRALARREPPEHYQRFTCFFSHTDNIVFPAATATLPGADNRHLACTAHVQMADHPAVLAAAFSER